MNRTGAAAAAVTAVLYGSAYVAVAVALDGFTPVGVAVWRGALGALVLVALVVGAQLVAPDRPRTARRSVAALVRLGALGLFGGGVFVLAMIAAVALTGATVTAFVAGLYAVAAAVLAIPLLGERPAPRTALALVAALIGTALLSEVWSGGESPAGVAMALVAAVSFGLFLVLSRRWASTYSLSSPAVGIASMSVSAVSALAVASVTGDALSATAQPPLPALVAIGWLALGPGAAATVLAVVAMRRLRAEQASLLLLLNPPTAAALAFLLLGERLDALQIIGAILTLAAIAVASVGLPRRTAFRRSSRRGSAPPTRS
jgi:drug/metabolite transporter (DMT)-like permease